MNLTSNLYRSLLMLIALSLAACGFHLRGLADISFQSLYIEHQGKISILNDLKRALASNGVKVVALPEQAEMHLDLMSEKTEKRILSLSGSGKVREYEVIYQVTFRTRESSSQNWGVAHTIEVRRDYTYDDTVLLAKEAEEARLYNDMRNDASREIMRRLSVLSSSKAAPAQ